MIINRASRPLCATFLAVAGTFIVGPSALAQSSPTVVPPTIVPPTITILGTNCTSFTQSGNTFTCQTGTVAPTAPVAAGAPTCNLSATGSISLPNGGGSVTFGVSNCTNNPTTYTWSGVPGNTCGTTITTCVANFPPNTTSTAVTYTVSVTPSNGTVGTTTPSSIPVTVAAAPQTQQTLQTWNGTCPNYSVEQMQFSLTNTPSAFVSYNSSNAQAGYSFNDSGMVVGVLKTQSTNANGMITWANVGFPENLRTVIVSSSDPCQTNPFQATPGWAAISSNGRILYTVGYSQTGYIQLNPSSTYYITVLNRDFNQAGSCNSFSANNCTLSLAVSSSPN